MLSVNTIPPIKLPKSNPDIFCVPEEIVLVTELAVVEDPLAGEVTGGFSVPLVVVEAVVLGGGGGGGGGPFVVEAGGGGAAVEFFTGWLDEEGFGPAVAVVLAVVPAFVVVAAWVVFGITGSDSLEVLLDKAGGTGVSSAKHILRAARSRTAVHNHPRDPSIILIPP